MWLAAQPTAPRGRTPASARQINNRQQADQVWSFSFNLEDFQRPDGVCGSFCAPFKFTGLI